MHKRGQIRLSFSVIFSIIVIIAIVSISAYVIVNFLRVGKCTEIGLFYSNMQKEIDKAWSSTFYQGKFNKGSLSSGIEFVCFGDLSLGYSGSEFREQYDFLSKFRRQDKNVFLYPSQEACDINLAFFKLEHAEINEFFCVPVEKGAPTFSVEKGELDALVKITK